MPKNRCESLTFSQRLQSTNLQRKRFKKMIYTQIVGFFIHGDSPKWHSGTWAHWLAEGRKGNEARWLQGTQGQLHGALQLCMQTWAFRPVPGKRATSGLYCARKTTQPLRRKGYFFTACIPNTRHCWGLYWVQGTEHQVRSLWVVIFMPELIVV